MDQRVDNERRSDLRAWSGFFRRPAAASPADLMADAAAKKGSLGGTLRKRRGLLTAIVIGGAVVAVLLFFWWLRARNYEWTDDAFIDARTVQISAQVAAAIVDVPVNDNQLVEAGAELVRLDDRDYIAQRDQAQASVDNYSGANRHAEGQDRSGRQAGGASRSCADLRATAGRSLSAARETGYRDPGNGAAIRVEPAAKPGGLRGRKGERDRDRETGAGTRGATADLPKRNWRRPRPICRAPSSPRRSPAASRG